jgi:uncharacterized protein YeaO (DUF488 family)
MIRIKRAYKALAREDGTRVLVDRVWPRGVKKEALRVSQWLKELGPSNELRKFFNHDPARWEEFRKRYRQELRSANARSMLRELAELAVKDTVTLVYGAKDETHNQAVVLREVLERMTRIGLDEGKESRGTSWN